MRPDPLLLSYYTQLLHVVAGKRSVYSVSCTLLPFIPLHSPGAPLVDTAGSAATACTAALIRRRSLLAAPRPAGAANRKGAAAQGRPEVLATAALLLRTALCRERAVEATMLPAP